LRDVNERLSKGEHLIRSEPLARDEGEAANARLALRVSCRDGFANGGRRSDCVACAGAKQHDLVEQTMLCEGAPDAGATLYQKTCDTDLGKAL
jgi:hypothetical protein